MKLEDLDQITGHAELIAGVILKQRKLEATVERIEKAFARSPVGGALPERLLDSDSSQPPPERR